MESVAPVVEQSRPVGLSLGRPQSSLAATTAAPAAAPAQPTPSIEPVRTTVNDPSSRPIACSPRPTIERLPEPSPVPGRVVSAPAPSPTEAEAPPAMKVRRALLVCTGLFVLAVIAFFAVPPGPRRVAATESGPTTITATEASGDRTTPPSPLLGNTPGAPGATTGNPVATATGPATSTERPAPTNPPIAAIDRGATPTSAPPSAAVIATHVVAADQTLWAIAQRHYGDGRQWPLIAQANPTVRPDRLTIGTVLTIPPIGQTATVAAGAASTAGMAGRTTGPLPATDARAVLDRPSGVGAAVRSVRVREGDTLSAIARREYGDGAKWDLIYRANRSRLRGPNAIRPGMVLEVPNHPEG